MEKNEFIKSISKYRTSLKDDEDIPKIILNDANNGAIDIVTYCLLSEYINKSIIVLPELGAFIKRGYLTADEKRTDRRLKMMYWGVIISLNVFLIDTVKNIIKIRDTSHLSFYYFLSGSLIISVLLILVSIVVYIILFSNR